MFTLLALAAVANATECIDTESGIIIEDDLMRVADDTRYLTVGGAELTAPAALLTGEGRGLISAPAEELAELRLAREWVFEDNVILRSDLAVEERASLIAAMGTEVLVFFASGDDPHGLDEDGAMLRALGYVVEDHIMLRASIIEDDIMIRALGYVVEDHIMLRAGALYIGTPEELDGVVPEDAVKLVTAPRCR